eukprot:2752796-Pleurochrysis_carterae.AAC.2
MGPRAGWTASAGVMRGVRPGARAHPLVVVLRALDDGVEAEGEWRRRANVGASGPVGAGGVGGGKGGGGCGGRWVGVERSGVWVEGL